MEKFKNVVKWIAIILAAVLVLTLGVALIRNNSDEQKTTINTVSFGQSTTIIYAFNFSNVLLKEYIDTGDYDINDCTFKIVPNVEAGSDYDFEFTVNGETKLFSNETDLTGGFSGENYDGNGTSISSGYGILIVRPNFSMSKMLYYVYGKSEITINDDIDISSYRYFAFSIISPDGDVLCELPFSINEYRLISINGMAFSMSNITFFPEQDFVMLQVG